MELSSEFQKTIPELNDAETFVLQARVMGLSNTETLEYLASNGHSITEGSLKVYRSNITEKTRDRIYDIASNMGGMHLERIESLKLIVREHWKNYGLAEKISEKTAILKALTELQQYLSSYYEATEKVVSNLVRRAVIIANEEKEK